MDHCDQAPKRAGVVPSGQTNVAPVPPFTMRVGIPHRSGALAFHAFNQGYAAMVSANAFWSGRLGRFCVPAATDLTELDLAVDSAGYVAMKLWKAKGRQGGMAGVFPWSYAQYVEFATSIGATWWAQPDLCVEPDIAQSQDEVDYRIRATATLLEGTLRVLYAWQCDLGKTCSAECVASLLPPPVPVVQGWKVSDYQQSAELLMKVWQRWQPWLAAPALIGVGSVCRRTLVHGEHGLMNVLSGLYGYLPSGGRLHLFGVKGAALDAVRSMRSVASADSMAYDFGARQDAARAGVSNTICRRSRAMSVWMRRHAGEAGLRHTF